MIFFDTEDLRDEWIYLDLKETADENPEQKWVPAYYFDICLLNGTRIGGCDLRIGHNEKTYYGGNVGYRIDEDYRGNRFASRACRLLFRLARRHGMAYLIITCSPDNIASYRTCEILDGQLLEIADIPEDNEMYKEGRRKNRIYRFSLDKE